MKPVMSTETDDSNGSWYMCCMSTFASMIIERRQRTCSIWWLAIEDLAIKIEGDEMSDVVKH